VSGRVQYLFNFLAHKTPIINPNGWGENSSYNLDFAGDMEISLREVQDSWIGKRILSRIGLGSLVKWMDRSVDAMCAIEACYGTRDLPKEERIAALKLDIAAGKIASEFASSKGWTLSNMSRDQATQVLNAVADELPAFTKRYGSPEQIMSRLPRGQSPTN
jgi:hypothetical protein